MAGRFAFLEIMVLLHLCSCSTAGDDGSKAKAPDAGLHLPTDLGREAADSGDPVLCIEGEWSCSGDGYLLGLCVNGKWEETDCLKAEGRLCEEGQCVEPWLYGSPVWSTCPDEPDATAETLSQKAAYYDEVATRLHIHPDLKWIMSVYLDQAVPETEATHADVVHWSTGENDGLWNGLYMASQAYRYAVTKSPEALDALKLTMEGEITRMEITGVPGLFTRQFIPPDVPGLACPAEDVEYVVDIEKDDNQWVRIEEDGCVWVVDKETLQWTGTDHCGLDDYAGWCWLDNVSQDEYAGHMYGLGAIARLVDDPGVHDAAVDLLEKVGNHLMVNHLTFVDWDGRTTEHGKMYPSSWADPPGYLALLSMDYVLMSAVASGRQDLMDFYDLCLLQKGAEPSECLPWPLEKPVPFTDYTTVLMHFLGPEGCESNFNNHAMLHSSMFSLIWYERDPEVREFVQNVFDVDVMRADNPKAGLNQLNAWYNFMWAAHKKLGPQSDGPAYDAVEEGICMLKQFAASKTQPEKNSADLYPHYCDGRLGNSMAEVPIPLKDRCPNTFAWWGNPYNRGSCTEEPWNIRHPADYLLAYWMGRYYGFIPEDL